MPNIITFNNRLSFIIHSRVPKPPNPHFLYARLSLDHRLFHLLLTVTETLAWTLGFLIANFKLMDSFGYFVKIFMAVHGVPYVRLRNLEIHSGVLLFLDIRL